MFGKGHPFINDSWFKLRGNLNTINENTVTAKIIIDEDINLVVQINGKKREVLKIKKDIKEKEVLKIIHNNDRIENYIKNKEIIKKIFVPNKIINLIIK